MRVLVVEDDPKIASFVTKGLRQAGFTVDQADDGEKGLALALSEPYAVLVVDIMLPGRDGLSLIQSLRRQKVGTPVIILSAKRSVDDRVTGLQRGGDDYLTKPFAFAELVVRLQALLRRAGADTSVAAGSLRLDPVAHVASAEGQKVPLTPTEFRLLAKLVANRGATVRRRDLVRTGWPHGARVRDNTLDAYVARLRRKLGELPGTPAITTVHGVGYILE